MNRITSQILSSFLIFMMMGCSSFRTVSLHPQSSTTHEEECLHSKSDYRIVFQDGRKIEIPGWAVQCHQESYSVYENSEWKFYSRTQISQIEERKVSVGKTIGLATGIAQV
jgi:hypothetical protein